MAKRPATIADLEVRRVAILPPDVDTTPNPFAFVDQTGVALSTVITSASITVLGINAPAPISVTGGLYDVNASGSFTSSAGLVNSGDTVRARVTSSASNSTVASATVTIGGVSDTFSATTLAASGSWLLPSSHTIPAKQAMILVYPRPNTETSAKARHRRAYYDGVNPIQYEITIGVAFGRPPFNFTLNSGPSGMVIDAVTGVVTWTPSGNVTGAACSVTVLDQDMNPLPVTWTVTTSSSTSDFIFVSPSGNNGNSGAIGSPLLDWTGAFGATFSATANAGAICYSRAGTYTLPGYLDNDINNSKRYFEMDVTRKPAALIAFPGETVIPNMASQIWPIAFASGGADFFMKGLRPDGNSNGNDGSCRFVVMTNLCDRLCFDDVKWSNVGVGNAPFGLGDNATMFFGSQEGTGRDYIFLNNCAELGGRTRNGNSYGLFSFYSTHKSLVQGCSHVGVSDSCGYLKGSNDNITVQYCDLDNGSSTGQIASEGFSDPSVSFNIEWRYNKIKSNGGRSTHSLQDPVNTLWIYRNSYYNTYFEIISPNTNGPYVFQNNAIAYTGGTIIPSGSQVSINDPTGGGTGSECHGTLAAGIMNSSTLALTGTFRTNYLGRRGYEIA